MLSAYDLCLKKLFGVSPTNINNVLRLKISYRNEAYPQLTCPNHQLLARAIRYHFPIGLCVRMIPNQLKQSVVVQVQ